MSVQGHIAAGKDFERVKRFYWDLIAEMKEEADVIGWKQGIYPTDDFLRESIEKKELSIFELEGEIVAAVIINSDTNEGYGGVEWSVPCKDTEVLVPHALGVKPSLQGKGIGKQVVQYLLDMGYRLEMKALRLDILKGNVAAEMLYRHMGFQFVEEKIMFYEDTGWTAYQIFERPL